MRKNVLMPTKGSLSVDNTYEGKSIEQVIRERMTGSDIEVGGKVLLYSERKDGVLPNTNIRTDRWEVAQQAYDTLARSHVARREASYNKDGGTNGDNKTEDSKGGKPTEPTSGGASTGEK